VLELYTTFEWRALCAELGKLKRPSGEACVR
jgi:hypothetical protein